MPVAVFNPDPRCLVNYQEVKEAWVRFEATYRCITHHNTLHPVAPPRSDGRPSVPHYRTAPHTRHFLRLMKELFASAGEVYRRCKDVLDTHLKWLHELKDRPECNGARLDRIIDACELTEYLQASCRTIIEAIDEDHAYFVNQYMDAYCPLGEPFHEICCEYDYGGGQRGADRIWKRLNKYKPMRLNAEIDRRGN